MSKGSKQRPSFITNEEFELRWELMSSDTTEERKLAILKQLQKIKEEKGNKYE